MVKMAVAETSEAKLQQAIKVEAILAKSVADLGPKALEAASRVAVKHLVHLSDVEVEEVYMLEEEV